MCIRDRLTGAVFRVLAAQDITDRQDNVIYEKGAVVVDSLTTAGAVSYTHLDVYKRQTRS